MSKWFRHYGGMMRDEKLVSVAVKSNQSVERVLWVYGAILESASEIDDGGRYQFDAAEAAYFLRADEADILAIENGLASSGRVDSNIVVNWSNRQYQSDKSVARQAAYRERKQKKKREGNDPNYKGDITPPSRDGEVTAQDTDTDTDIKKEPKEVLQKEKRGSRLPDDFQPDQTCIAIADELAMTAEHRQLEYEKFKDYWKGKAGAAGIKLDWQATFRNWLRNSIPKKGKSYENGRGGIKSIFAEIDERLNRNPFNSESTGGAEHGKENFNRVSRLRESAA